MNEAWNEEIILDVVFSSNHNIHKSSCGLCFWASSPLIEIICSLSIKGSVSPKQSPQELLWMLWFDEKVYLKLLI